MSKYAKKADGEVVQEAPVACAETVSEVASAELQSTIKGAVKAMGDDEEAWTLAGKIEVRVAELEKSVAALEASLTTRIEEIEKFLQEHTQDDAPAPEAGMNNLQRAQARRQAEKEAKGGK